MFPFAKTFPSPEERTKGLINSKEYLAIHHTGTKEGTINGVLDGLYRRADYASCHFVVDEAGNAYKIGSPDDVLWHVGVSAWNGRTDMNRFCLGIEVIGPLKDGGFTDAQRHTVRALIEHLMAVYKIPKENVLRHADFTHEGSPKGILWDGVSKSRKTDIAPSFWAKQFEQYPIWRSYQNSLIPKQM